MNNVACKTSAKKTTDLLNNSSLARLVRQISTKRRIIFPKSCKQAIPDPSSQERRAPEVENFITLKLRAAHKSAAVAHGADAAAGVSPNFATALAGRHNFKF